MGVFLARAYKNGVMHKDCEDQTEEGGSMLSVRVESLFVKSPKILL